MAVSKLHEIKTYLIPITKESEKYQDIVNSLVPGGRRALIKLKEQQDDKKPPAA